MSENKKGRGLRTLSPITKHFHYDDATDKYAIEYRQDVQDILDHNKIMRNHVTQTGDFRHTMEIPINIIHKWKNELGFDLFDPDNTPEEIDKFLDRIKKDPEWAYLKTQ